jgi:dihydrodipicolinate synthase/N-acetylneuraminate lyase
VKCNFALSFWILWKSKLMVQRVTPRGLICSLALVADPSNPDVYQGLEALIARLRPAMAGLFLDPMYWNPEPNFCGPVSESLLEEVIGLIPPGLPLWVRITGRTAEQTIYICRQLESACRRLGYQGPLAWVDTPLFYHSNRGLPQHYETLLAETEFGLLVDNNPQLVEIIPAKTKRKNIRTTVLKSLAKEARIAGLLHRGDLQRGMNYQRAVRDRYDFPIYDAEERRFLKRPSASGVVSVGANLLPQDWRSIAMASLNLDERRHEQDGRFRHLWDAGVRVRTLHNYYNHAPARIIAAVLTAWGLIEENGRTLTPEEKKAVDSILEHVPEP